VSARRASSTLCRGAGPTTGSRSMRPPFPIARSASCSNTPRFAPACVAGADAGGATVARSIMECHPTHTDREGSTRTFPDPELSDPARAYYGSNLDRLQVVKRNYDPDWVFHSGPLWVFAGLRHRRRAVRVREGGQSELAARSHARPMRPAPRCGRTRKTKDHHERTKTTTRERTKP
jgi:Berberine and berberine like